MNRYPNQSISKHKCNWTESFHKSTAKKRQPTKQPISQTSKQANQPTNQPKLQPLCVCVSDIRYIFPEVPDLSSIPIEARSHVYDAISAGFCRCHAQPWRYVNDGHFWILKNNVNNAYLWIQKDNVFWILKDNVDTYLWIQKDNVFWILKDNVNNAYLWIQKKRKKDQKTHFESWKNVNNTFFWTLKTT